MRTLAALLEATAARHADRPALRSDDRVVTWGRLADRAGRLASLLGSGHGVRPGDRVALLVPNVPEFAVALFGVLRAGGIVVPLNVALRPGELAIQIRDVSPTLVLAWEGLADSAREAVDADGPAVLELAEGALDQVLDAVTTGPPPMPAPPADAPTALIFFTSGMTGRSRGACLSHESLLRNAEFCGRMLMGLTPDDVVMGAVSLFHAFGLTVSLLSCACTGACLTLMSRFSPDRALDLLDEHGVTVLVAVPTVLAALHAAGGPGGRDVSRLRQAICGGSALSIATLAAFEEEFGCLVLEGYGLSEGSPVVSVNPPTGRRKPGSAGLPIPGVEVLVVDDAGRPMPVEQTGELAVRGYNVMLGYWGDPHATAQVLDGNGWLRTGDLGSLDRDGFIHVGNRKDDVIRRGGQNVIPAEVEEVLLLHPAVEAAAVVGIPDEMWGEEVGAALVPAEAVAGDPPEPSVMTRFVAERLASFKAPTTVWWVPRLPVGPAGEVLRREVRPPGAGGSGPLFDDEATGAW